MKNPTLTLTIQGGRQIRAELYPEQAPQTVANFIHLTQNKFFDGQAFWRVEKDRLIQGGCPNNNGSGKIEYCIKGEYIENGVNNTLTFTPGTLGMGRLTPDSAFSAFFITVSDVPELDGRYAAFGRVIEGFETAEEISQGAAGPMSEEITFVNVAKDPVFVETVIVETFGVQYPEPDRYAVPSEEEMKAELERLTKERQDSNPAGKYNDPR